MVAGLVSGRRDTREICNRAVERGEFHRNFIDDICNHFHTVTGIELPDGDLARKLQASSIDHYLTFLEVAMNDLWDFRRHKEDFDVLQSILADDDSVFRFRESPSGAPRFTIIEIDNPHLKREIIDRTLELTANLEMQAAQADYEDAWKAYARGDFAPPDANIALLGLHLSGSLVFFLAKSWESRLGAEE